MAQINFQFIILISIVFAFLSFLTNFVPVSGIKCPGKCISNITHCRAKGGRIAGYCTNELACCDYSYRKMGTCGSNMSKLTTAFFKSPEYPEYDAGDLICQFDFILNANATGILVEFIDVTMDGSGFIANSPCESDQIFFKGFPEWTPPVQCGNLTDYVAVIDLHSRQTEGMKTFTLLAIMSSKKYRWNIKVTQVTKARRGPINKIPEPDEEYYMDDEDDEGLDDVIPEPANKSRSVMDEHRESEEEELSRLSHISRLISRDQVRTTLLDSSTLDQNILIPGEENSEYEAEEEPFIVNGFDTEITSVPWQASLRSLLSENAKKLLPELDLKNCTIDEGLHFCGGTVISDKHILSATHCFFLGEKLATWQRLSKIKVVLGDTNTCDEVKDGVQEFKVDKVYFHYAYDNNIIMNDLVVIKIKGRIKFDDRTKPIKLAKEGMTFDHQIATASGWGLTNLTVTGTRKKSPERLQSATDLFIGNKTYCSKQQIKLYPTIRRIQLLRYPKYMHAFSSLLCTYVRNGSVARVVGQGDSGGPLVIYPDKQENFTETVDQDPILIGVISYMIPIPHSRKKHDVSNYVDFYQSVSFFRNWINIAMQ